MLQCLRRLPNSFQVLNTISRIVTAYNSDAEPWVVGYSGGKDSTAVVKLIFQSLLRIIPVPIGPFDHFHTLKTLGVARL
jgi:3'-phosphoadenosine 5'-phosphosulfate sulfotransferase (PAPS reductase)/FAD synthetase